jgi:hypothetical protein
VLSQAGTPQPQRRRRRTALPRFRKLAGPPMWGIRDGARGRDRRAASGSVLGRGRRSRRIVRSKDGRAGPSSTSETLSRIDPWRATTIRYAQIELLGSDRPQLRAYNVRYMDQVWTFVKNRSVVTCRDNRLAGCQMASPRPPDEPSWRGGLGRFRSRPLLLIGTEVATSATDAVDLARLATAS